MVRTLREELKIDTRMPLTFAQLRVIMQNRVTGLKCNYVDLEEFRGDYTVENFFKHDSNASLVLLSAMIAGQKQRHWVVILKHTDGKFSFFDSLALGLHKVGRLLKDARFPKFLQKINADVNHKRLQSKHLDVATCGLHCVCRMLKHDLKNHEYNHWIMSIRTQNPDEIVVWLTYIGHVSVNLKQK